MPDHAANRNRQDKGLQLLKEQMPGFYVPDKVERQQLLELLGISKRFQQTFDGIRLHVPIMADIKSAKDFDLLEIKSTDKCLPSLPEGFFFGLTENEEMLLKVFDGKYFLCLVSLHPSSAKFTLLGWNELQRLIQHKRVQYQINLSGKTAAAGR